MDAVKPLDVIAVLNQEKLRLILVGAYGLAGWVKAPRATEDIDFVVLTKHHKKAIKALTIAFPTLQPDDQEMVTRFRDKDTQEPVIDLMKQTQAHFSVAFKHTQTVTAEGQTYHVPTLELALAKKFASMIRLTRADEKKYLDAHDFITTVKVNAVIDREVLGKLGEFIYPGGGKELVQKVEAVRAGRKLQL